MSSFNNTLAVPWPAVYYSLTQALSVVSLQLLKLPTVACIQPEVSFYVVFDGTTVTLLIFFLFLLVPFYAGSRAPALRDDPARRRRFRTRVINNGIWAIFLVFPQARGRRSRRGEARPRFLNPVPRDAGERHHAAHLFVHHAGGRHRVADGGLCVPRAAAARRRRR